MTRAEYTAFIELTCIWFGSWRHWMKQTRKTKQAWFDKFMARPPR